MLLLKLMRFGDAKSVLVTVSWRTLDGKKHQITETVPVLDLTSGQSSLSRRMMVLVVEWVWVVPVVSLKWVYKVLIF